MIVIFRFYMVLFISRLSFVSFVFFVNSWEFGIIVLFKKILCISGKIGLTLWKMESNNKTCTIYFLTRF